jgi:predicted DNA-binding transcriptional regulator YafY
MAKGDLSYRWLNQEKEREEVYLENNQLKRRVLVRAQAFDAWRIIQQLQKYGDKVELVDPPELRERMRQQAERIASYYQKKPDRN